jgi:hypothetical protein
MQRFILRENLMQAQETKVSMILDQEDSKNAEELQQKFHTDNLADIISQSLAIVAWLSQEVGERDELILRKRDGKRIKVTIPYINE